MQRVNSTAPTQINTQSARGAHASIAGQGLKNLAAMHELMTREGFCLPDFNSKFINRDTLTQIYNGSIYCMKADNMVYR